jgi:hypothetical protein
MSHYGEGPPGKEDRPPENRKPINSFSGRHATPTAIEHTCKTGRCGRDEPCACYGGKWIVKWPDRGHEPLEGDIRSGPYLQIRKYGAPAPGVSVQLRRRREAAHRLPPLACGRRDPISQSWW